jgi:hypothetical protein
VGFLFDLLRGAPDPLIEAATAVQSAGPAFAITPADIPAAVFGLESYTETVAPTGKINRQSAMQVPAVKRCRDLIAGSIGSLPVVQLDANLNTVNNTLFEQPERDLPRSVTMTRTVEDILFEGVAWWKVTERAWNGYPTKVKRLEPGTVDVGKDGKVYTTRAGHTGTTYEYVADKDLIRFDSPNSALLWAGARAIRAALALDAAALRHADGSPPIDYFTPAEGADPASDEDVVDLLTDWQTARRNRSTGYVPAALKYNVAGWDPEKLQLAEARQHAVLEIARAAGVDPEELGVSTTSRTYANQFDRRKAFTDFTLGAYMVAVQDRLSMPDVTPRGWYVRFNLDGFLRSDTLTRYQSYQHPRGDSGAGGQAAAGRPTPGREYDHADHPPRRRERHRAAPVRPRHRAGDHARRARRADVQGRHRPPHHHRPGRPVRGGGLQPRPEVPVLQGLPDVLRPVPGQAVGPARRPARRGRHALR